jgi:hypothetical protein
MDTVAVLNSITIQCSSTTSKSNVICRDAKNNSCRPYHEMLTLQALNQQCSSKKYLLNKVKSKIKEQQ